MDQDFKLFLWQAAFIIYVGLHLTAKARRFWADLDKKRKARKRSKRGWF